MVIIAVTAERNVLPLFNHQERAVDFILKVGSGALFMDMGTGKTRCAIEAFGRMRERTPGLKMVVIAPLSLLEAAWGEDIRRFSELTYYNAHDKGLPLRAVKEDILLINYEGIIQAKNAHIAGHVKDSFLVIDESSRMKSTTTKTTKMILSLKDLARQRVIMSGTPAPNTPLEYWAQMEFLCSGVLGSSFNQFRNMYFSITRGNQTIMEQGRFNPGFITQMINQGRITASEGNLLLRGIITRHLASKIFSVGAEYTISKDNMARIMDTIKPLVFWAKKEDCLDLPEQVDEVRMVEMDAQQKKHYKEMKTDLITMIRDQAVTAPVALTKIMKLREITSGFAIDTQGVEVELAPGAPPKIRELEAILDEAGDRQVIIWACFRWDIQRIVAFLAARYGQDSVRTLYSGTSDHLDSINAFKAGTARFLVANPASAAHGLTLTCCSLEVFYSLDYSWERYVQGKARIHRAGQTCKCTYVHIIARDTIDEEILKCLRTKGDVNEIAYKLMR
jgi:SNF2 family DNA or RNA helicase